MPQPPLPSELADFLRQPNPCVVATLRSNGEPHTAATWYEWTDDGQVLLNMDASRVRLTHLRNDPRVSLTVLDARSWYSHLSLVGRVCEIRPDAGLADIDRLSRRYDGRPYGDRSRDSWTAIAEVARWHAWGALRASSD
jgi:PPOX class probable F420-dependent enzyme